MEHEHHDHSMHENASAHIDPMCGMTVEEAPDAGTNSLGMERGPNLGRVTRRVVYGAGTQSPQGFSASGIAGLDDLRRHHSIDPRPRVDHVSTAAMVGHCARTAGTHRV